MYVRSGVADGYFPHFFLLARSLAKKRKKKKAARERKSEADTVRAEQFHLSCSLRIFSLLYQSH
jgi:hypothetical protein